MQGNTSVVASCFTSSNGTCTMAMPSLPAGGGVLAGLVLVGGQALILPSVLTGAGPDHVQHFLATIVVDRLVVQQGDSLHVTGMRLVGRPRDGP